jgi:hypothetical protein
MHRHTYKEWPNADTGKDRADRGGVVVTPKLKVTRLSVRLTAA